MVIPLVPSLAGKSLECEVMKNRLALPGRKKEESFSCLLLLTCPWLKIILSK